MCEIKLNIIQSYTSSRHMGTEAADTAATGTAGAGTATASTVAMSTAAASTAAASKVGSNAMGVGWMAGVTEVGWWQAWRRWAAQRLVRWRA